MGRGGSSGCENEGLEQRSQFALSADEAGWIALSAEKLRRLDGAPGRSWRSDAAARLEEIVAEWETSSAPAGKGGRRAIGLADGDASLFDQVAFELVAEENPRALEQGSTTWQTVAGDELAALAIRARAVAVH
jgi:hypothetical protein